MYNRIKLLVFFLLFQSHLVMPTHLILIIIYKYRYFHHYLLIAPLLTLYPRLSPQTTTLTTQPSPMTTRTTRLRPVATTTTTKTTQPHPAATTTITRTIRPSPAATITLPRPLRETMATTQRFRGTIRTTGQ